METTEARNLIPFTQFRYLGTWYTILDIEATHNGQTKVLFENAKGEADFVYLRSNAWVRTR